MSKTRTNIVIDDELMARAMAATGARTKREAVEEALRRVSLAHSVEQLGNQVSDEAFHADYLADLKQPRWSYNPAEDQHRADRRG